MSASAAGFSAEWDVATAERVARVGEWDLLFDRLDAAGCELGVGGRMRALGLVGRLAVAGAELSDPGILQSYLVPIFATSTERAGDIDTIIAHWAERAALGNSATRWRRRTASSAESDAISTVIHTDRRSMHFIDILI